MKRIFGTLLGALIFLMAFATVAGARVDSDMANWLFAGSVVEVAENVVLADNIHGYNWYVGADGKIIKYRPALGNMCFDGRYVYGISNGKFIMRMKADGSGREILHRESAVYELCHMGGYLYYTTDVEGTEDSMGMAELRRLPVGGGEPETIYSVKNRIIQGVWAIDGRIFIAQSEEYDIEGHAVAEILNIGPAGAGSQPPTLNMEKTFPNMHFEQFYVYKGIVYITMRQNDTYQVYETDTLFKKTARLKDWVYYDEYGALYKGNLFYIDTEMNIYGAALCMRSHGKGGVTVLDDNFTMNDEACTIRGFCRDEIIYSYMSANEEVKIHFRALNYLTGKERDLVTITL